MDLADNEFTLKAAQSSNYPGLLDAKNVGVKEDDFYNQRLYGSENKQNVYVLDATAYLVDGTDKKMILKP